jgi:hypothetical protein
MDIGAFEKGNSVLKFVFISLVYRSRTTHIMPHEQPNNPSSANHSPLPAEPLVTLDNFVRLKESQQEFLAWLEATEQKAEIDGYTYRKIR